MKWKICLIAFINICLLTFPYNIIGCGPETDPYDYYTSFFLNNLADAKGYQPFFYTNELFLYDTEEPADAAHATSAEWISYCGNKATREEAYDFVCRYSFDELTTLYENMQKGKNDYLSDSVKINSISKYFLQHKDFEALGYLIYAKKVEPNVTGSWNNWDGSKRDSMQMDLLIKSGKQLYAGTKKDFIKLRYAYQITRLALYSGNIKDCIRYYDEMIGNNKSQSILQDLATSLKAGALLRSGNKYQAALLFSKQFSRSSVKKVSNYMSFDWCVKRLDEDDRKNCLALCKTNEEKANLLGLFALGSINNEEVALKTIFALAPKTEMLEVLAVREINKIEENYFSHALSAQKGGDRMYISWEDTEAGEKNNAWLNEAKSLQNFYHEIAQSPATTGKALFETGAAYLSYITKDYDKAKKYLQNISELNPPKKIKDQASLTQLLIMVNEKQVADSTFENAILPQVKWLQKKALEENKSFMNKVTGDLQETPWQIFYRNFFAEILAKRYHAQKDIYKEALCIGNGEAITKQSYSAEYFLENNVQTKDALTLYKLMKVPKKTAWENFICNNFPVHIDKIKEVIAVSYIRDYNFTLAVQWLGNIKNKELIKLNRNPFADILFDSQDSTFPFDYGNFNKISFLKEMTRLTNKEKQGNATAADLYKLAIGYYNMTYYGRSWELIKYYRSGSDGYYVPGDALPFDREYYGCYTAEKYFQKAMNAYTDKNKQARCLFMTAKCAQKRNEKQPAYDFGYNNSKDFLLFKYNKYFPRLVKDYGKTEFFEEAYNTCSYLKDFVDKK
ncbi:MAG: hypothetical protein ABI863_04660 [Ginsengibacter sp.]